MSDRTECAHCGGPIPPRTDPRGRAAKFCSDACRAAAHRARREREHRAEVAQARAQMALRLPAEEAADAARLVREMTNDLRAGREFPMTPQHENLVAAIKDFADLMDAHTAATQPPAASLSRQQRRAQQRKKRRK